jgi:hypothetical protein
MKSRSGADPALQARHDVAARYERQGYTVLRDPSELPEGLEMGGGVDFIARRGDEIVFVEIKRTAGSAGSAQFDAADAELAAAVQRLPGARLDLVVLPDIEEVLPSADDVLKLTGQARRLLKLAKKDKALSTPGAVLAGSAVEGILRVLAYQCALPVHADTGLVALASALRSEGLLGESDWEILDSFGRSRNALVHGLRPIAESGAWHVEQLISLAEALVDQVYLREDDVISWFHERYEDPAHHIPFDSAEGGYQYPPGEPSNAREVLEERFPYVPPSVLEKAINILESESTEWVHIEES